MRHLGNLGISKILFCLDLARTNQTLFCEHQFQNLRAKEIGQQYPTCLINKNSAM